MRKLETRPSVSYNTLKETFKIHIWLNAKRQQCSSVDVELSIIACRLNEHQMFIRTAYWEKLVMDIHDWSVYSCVGFTHISQAQTLLLSMKSIRARIKVILTVSWLPSWLFSLMSLR